MSKRSERNSLYIDSHGPNPEGVKKGFAWLYQISKQDEDKRHGIVAVNTKKNLDNIQDTIEELIGAGGFRSLRNDNRVTIEHLQVSLVTNRIRPSGWRSGPALVLYPSDDLLDTVDGLHGVTDVLVVPWHRESFQPWIDTWNASDLEGDSGDDKAQEIISDPVLEEALETLHGTVNSSTGVTHPSDRSSAIELFKILEKGGISYDPAEVRAWLVAEKSWDPDHANDVQEIAEGVLEGRRFQYERGRWTDDLLELLRERAENQD